MSLKTNHPKLTLVGAGPGDPELFTLKGIKALQQADVVLYDALANPELLDYAPEDSLKIFVGKRRGQHSLVQEEIQQLIVEYALAYGHVVRLKGGDPFVFARGSEELAYAREFGIETAVVPGISSAFGVPAYQEIPLTHRGISESFWVLTGTTTNGQITHDLSLALQSSATIVILMGMSKLPFIIQQLHQHGKEEVPMAIIQNGTTANEKCCMATASDMLEEVQRQQLSNPAIIVIGEVVTRSQHWETLKKQLHYAA